MARVYTQPAESLPGDGSKRPAPLPDSVREVLEGLDTGDLILFDRPCSRMGSVIGAIICSTAKVVGGSPFDHIGVVVRDEDGNNVLVEASFSGVAVRPLCERVRRSSASQICVRRLQTNRTEEMRAEACRFVSEVADVPYTNTAPGLLQMAFSSFRYHPAKERRRRMHAETVGLSASISSLEKELEICQSTTERAQVLNDRLRRALTQRRKAQVFLDDAADQERPVASPPSPPQPSTTTAAPPENESLPLSSPVPSSPPPPPGSLPPSYPAGLTTSYEGGLFCSELVAALYQRLGLFDAPYPARHDYVPADFTPPLGAEGDRGVGGGGDANKDATDTEYYTSDGERRPGDAFATVSPPLLLDDEIRVALLRGAALEPGHWIRGGPGSASCTPPPPPPTRPVEKEDGEPGGGGLGGSSSSPPASSSGAAEIAQPFQRVVLGYAKELGEQRGIQPGRGRGMWLPRLQGVRLPSLNPIAYLPPPARLNPKDYMPIFASVAPICVPPDLSQLAWSLHVFSRRAGATATAFYSAFAKEVVGLKGTLTVPPRKAWRPALNGIGTRPELEHWVPVAATADAAVTVAAERRRTTMVDDGPLLSAFTARHDRAEYGVLDCTVTSAAIVTVAAAAAAAAAATTALTAVRTCTPAGRGNRLGAVAMTRGGGWAALALLTVGAACGLASELGPAGDRRAEFFRRVPIVSTPAQSSLLTCWHVSTERGGSA